MTKVIRINNAADFAKAYSKHLWEVDVEVYIYLESKLTDAELDERIDAVKATLRGEAYFATGGLGDRGFAFFAEDADWNALDPILAELEWRGCIIDFPDWFEWMDEHREQD